MVLFALLALSMRHAVEKFQHPSHGLKGGGQIAQRGVLNRVVLLGDPDANELGSQAGSFGWSRQSSIRAFAQIRLGWILTPPPCSFESE